MTATLEVVPATGPAVRRAVMVQHWADVVFLHWRYDPAEVQRLLAPGVVVDTFDGSAWVALVPFSMRGLGVPWCAPLPHVGAFPEVNVRTYVRAGGRRGVWFFSLDVDRLLPALVARRAYHLPYFSGAARHDRSGSRLSTLVRRRWPTPGAHADLAVVEGEPIDPGDPLARFLTSRWGLVSATRRGALRWAPVAHPPWHLRRATVESLEESLLAAAGLTAPVGDPHAMCSPGVDVRVGRPVRLRAP